MARDCEYIFSKEERSFRGYELIGSLMLSLLPQSTATTALPLLNQQRR